MASNQTLRFREAKRTQESFLAVLEKKTLVWLAARTPSWINSDHLTLLGLAAMAGAGAGYWWSRTNPVGLLLVIACLALNWLGDSLDGTLARFRNHQRPRYGYYVDHVVDAFGALFLLGGLALSGYMHPAIAFGLLIAYFLLSIEVFLAAHSLGRFKITYFNLGPTELRILRSIGNLALLVHPHATIFGQTYRLFDVGGAIAVACQFVTLVVSAIRNTRELYRAEPIPGRS